MSSVGKRFVASLLGVRLDEDAPQLTSLVPQRISNDIMSGKLPKFNPSTILLGKNETCHFMDKAALVVKQKEKSYSTRRSGSSYKMSKNWTIHSSNGRTEPIVQEWYEYKEGVVFITNQRIIFVAPEYGFEKKVKNLTAVIPYSDGIGLQFGSQKINLMVPESILMLNILQMVH